MAATLARTLAAALGRTLAAALARTRSAALARTLAAALRRTLAATLARTRSAALGRTLALAAFAGRAAPWMGRSALVRRRRRGRRRPDHLDHLGRWRLPPRGVIRRPPPTLASLWGLAMAAALPSR